MVRHLKKASQRHLRSVCKRSAQTIHENFISLYVKDLFESNYELLINGREEVRMKKLKNPKTFIDYSQTIDDVYDNLEDYNPSKKKKVCLVLDVMIADMESYKKLSPIVAELFLRGKKLNISLIFILQSCCKVSKTIRLNTTYYFYHENS